MYSPRAGKRITVYTNGDPFAKGRHVTLNTRQMPEFDTFCSYLTKMVPNPTGGCYRRLYTPGGSEVYDLEDIQAGGDIVAAKDKFINYSYREISYQSKVPRRKGFKKIDGDRIYTPVVHATEERLRNQVGRAYYLAEHRRGLRLRVHVNGMEERPSCLVKVQYNDRDNYTRILAEIEAAMSLQPIQRVYKVNNLGGISENFSEIRDAGQLENNDHILVLPRNKCSNLQCKVYALEGMDRFKVSTSPRAGTYHMYPSFKDGWTNKHDRNLNKHKLLPSIGSSSKKSDSMSPFSNTPGSQRGGGGRNNVRSKGAGEVDYDRDDGLYRAKRQNNPHRAQQDQDENVAATKIQAGFHGYNARRRYKAKKDAVKQEREDESRRRDDAQSQDDDARHMEIEAQEQAKKKRMNEDLAATKIQAAVRGHNTRKGYKYKKGQK